MGSTVGASHSISSGSGSSSSSTLSPPQRPGPRRQILAYCPEYDVEDISELLHFGPNYTIKLGDSFWDQQKKEALTHVLTKSDCSHEELKNEIGSVQDEAKAAYCVDVLSNMTRDFCDTMAEDGCFFLLLCFSILGAGPELKFPDDHLLFGMGRATEHLTWWLRSIFLVGNQVPFTVLKKLMNSLRFFSELKASKRYQWSDMLPDDDDHPLSTRTIHKFLMSEAREEDIIHCLQSVILGTTTTTTTTTIPDRYRYSVVIPSASLLSGKGVQFEKLEGGLGVRSIHYRHSTLLNFCPVLYLPGFLVDEHTQLMVECLAKYETVQFWTAKIEPEASSYFEFLKELIPTTEDLGVLYSSGVIRGEPDRLRRILFKFQCTETSAHLCRVRRQIKEDTPYCLLPPRKLRKGICAVSTLLVLLLTYLQAHYDILSYYHRNVR